MIMTLRASSSGSGLVGNDTIKLFDVQSTLTSLLLGTHLVCCQCPKPCWLSLPNSCDIDAVPPPYYHFPHGCLPMFGGFVADIR